jgi:holo-[acyl-carrier protein] synthase
MKAVGIDAIEIERIAGSLAKHGDRFAEKVYTANERTLAEGRSHPTEGSAEFFAGRFAAKEAVLKVLGTGWSRGLGFQDVEILRELDGRPSVVLHGPAAELARALGFTRIHISITHTRTTAMAVAAAE